MASDSQEDSVGNAIGSIAYQNRQRKMELEDGSELTDMDLSPTVPMVGSPGVSQETGEGAPQRPGYMYILEQGGATQEQEAPPLNSVFLGGVAQLGQLPQLTQTQAIAAATVIDDLDIKENDNDNDPLPPPPPPNAPNDPIAPNVPAQPQPVPQPAPIVPANAPIVPAPPVNDPNAPNVPMNPPAPPAQQQQAPQVTNDFGNFRDDEKQSLSLIFNDLNGRIVNLDENKIVIGMEFEILNNIIQSSRRRGRRDFFTNENGQQKPLTYKNYVIDKYVGLAIGKFSEFKDITALRSTTRYYYQRQQRPIIFTRVNQVIFNLYETAVQSNVKFIGLSKSVN